MQSDAQQKLLEQQHHDRELIVHVYVLYRLLVASMLLATMLLPEVGSLLAIETHRRFSVSVSLYLATAVVTAIIVYRHDVTHESATRLMLWSDILLLPLVMVDGGNFSSSISLLLALSFLFGSLTLQRGYALRALAATLMLTAAYWLGTQLATETNLTAVGSMVMGFIYLLIGVLSAMLARHLQLTKKILLRQHLSLENQIDVNDFIIQELDNGALVVDRQLRIQSGNAAAWKMLGRTPDTQGMPLAVLAPGLVRELQGWQTAADGAVTTSAAVPLRDGVAARFTDFGGRSGGTLIMLQNLKELEERAQQKKLAALGKLTAGVAHEIRNPLSAIQQAAQLLAEAPAREPRQRRLLEIIESNTRRINGLVEEILTLARRKPQPQTLDLHAWLPPLVDEYRATLSPGECELHLELDDGAPGIRFDAEQLRQVLLNLLDNARRHAVPQRGELVVTVRAGGSGALPTIEVRDNGGGFAPEVREQLFDPFFTTSNSSTGLGLYLSRELCLNNSAGLEFIELESGSAFRISGKPA